MQVQQVIIKTSCSVSSHISVTKRRTETFNIGGWVGGWEGVCAGRVCVGGGCVCGGGPYSRKCLRGIKFCDFRF